MNSIIITGLVLVALFLLFVILPFVILWFLSIVGSGAPFVPVPHESVPGIVDALELKEGSVVYDMGCGDGRILAACLKKYPRIRAVGIETAYLPYLFARVRARRFGSDRLRIIRGDFFKENVGSATHIVLYLFPELMDKLLPKLQQELKPGTRVLAIDFHFSEKSPTRVTETEAVSSQRGHTLTLYTF